MTAEWPGLPADRPGRDPGASLPDAVLPGMGLQGAVGTAADPSGAVPGRPDPRPRPVPLRLARLHLRTGSISLASTNAVIAMVCLLGTGRCSKSSSSTMTY